MSQISLSGNSGGTGVFTIQSPATNTNRTLTLPDNTGTVLTDQSTVSSTQIASALNASGSAPIYAARAWVNFNGTGTVAIRASGNVTSITDNGIGNYTVNFTTAMPDANYVIAGVAGNGGASTAFDLNSYNSGANTASSAFIVTYATNTGTGTDAPYVAIAIFR